MGDPDAGEYLSYLTSHYWSPAIYIDPNKGQVMDIFGDYLGFFVILKIPLKFPNNPVILEWTLASVDSPNQLTLISTVKILPIQPIHMYHHSATSDSVFDVLFLCFGFFACFKRIIEAFLIAGYSYVTCMGVFMGAISYSNK